MIVRAGWVLPISAPPIRDGYVEIDGSRIQRVGAWAELQSVGSTASAGSTATGDSGVTPTFHYSHGVLLPGFVNPHTHLELTGYAGMIPQSSFWPWIGRLARLRKEQDTPERIEAAVIAGARECLRNGITCVGDISRRNESWRTLKKLPIRKVCFAELLSLADFPPRTLSELRSAVESIEEDALLTAGISPHAPYTVPLEDVRGAIELAARLDRPWTLHLGETPEELAFLAGHEGALPGPIGQLVAAAGIRSPRMDLAEYVKSILANLGEQLRNCRRKGSFAHMNYAGEATWGTLADAGVPVLYCPGAHRFFGHPPHPFRRMLEEYVPVALGTDSAASNSGLSMISEMRVAREADRNIPAERLLRAATLGGACALGLDSLIGSLVPGKQADLAVFELPSAAVEPQEALLRITGSATAVWVAGQLDFVAKSS